MDRFKTAKIKYPFLKLRLCYYCIKENFRNKTSFRQKYFVIRNNILKFFKSANVSYEIKGMEKIKDSSLFVVKTSNDYEKMLVFSAISKPLNVILNEYEFEGFINNQILKYMDVKRISSYDEIKDLDINNNYIMFVDEINISELKSNLNIVPVLIKNGSLLFDELNYGNVKIEINI